MFNIIFLVLILFSSVASATPSVNRSFGVDNGINIYTPGGNQFWFSGGQEDPRDFPGVDAPIGSVFYRITGEIFIKTGAGPQAWTLRDIVSTVFIQSQSFFRSGGIPANTALYVFSGIPSTSVGGAVASTEGYLSTISCSNENELAYSINIYKHNGGMVNSVLLDTLTTTGKSGYKSLNNPVNNTEQIALEVTTAGTKDMVCTLTIKGVL